MDSSNMGNVAVVERGFEDMGCWSNGYEVPNVNGQNFNSYAGNGQNWNQAPFGEARKRPTRGKQYHGRGRNYQQQQAAWTEPAQASPHWQPQPPPPAVDTNFGSFQEPQGPAAVNLHGLPYALCKQNFLEAMLDQAGLGNDIMGCVLGDDQDTGKAIIYLASYNAAVKCVQHFGGRRWDTAGSTVTAQIADVQAQQAPAESAPQPRALGTARTGARKQRGGKNGQEQFINMPPTGGAWAIAPQTGLPPMAMDDYHKGSDFSPEMAGGNSPARSTGSGNNSPSRTNWADLSDENNERENDLSEGLEGSTSAGSTGRNSKDTGDSFFFGCDVDTDDGF